MHTFNKRCVCTGDCNKFVLQLDQIETGNSSEKNDMVLKEFYPDNLLAGAGVFEYKQEILRVPEEMISIIDRTCVLI